MSFSKVAKVSITLLYCCRYDPAYIDDRRYGLEVYLRSLLRLEYFIDNCPSLRNFLNISVLVPQDMFSLERDAFDTTKAEYTHFYEPEPDDDSFWKPVNMNLFRSLNPSSVVDSVSTSVANLNLDGSPSLQFGRVGDHPVLHVGLMASAGSNTSASNCQPLSPVIVDSESDHESDEDDDDDERIAAQAIATMAQSAANREVVAGSLGTSRFASVFIDGNMERKNSFRREDSVSPAVVSASPSSSRFAGGAVISSGDDELLVAVDSVGGDDEDDNDEDGLKRDEEDSSDSRLMNDDPNDIWAMSLAPHPVGVTSTNRGPTTLDNS